MGVRARLTIVVLLVLGSTLFASLTLLLRLEAHDERRGAAERAIDLVEAVSVPLAVQLEEADREDVENIVAAVENTRASLGIERVSLYDADGFDVAHGRSLVDEQDPFLKEALKSPMPLSDPPSPAWPVRVSHPLVSAGLRYTLVAHVANQGVEERLSFRAQRIFWTSLFLSTIGLFVLLLLLSREVLSPIKELKRIASALARGDLAHRATLRGGAELRVLAMALNDAARRLGEQKQHLEREVARRTDELTHANRELSSMNERLQQLALTDPLTGLFNRRALEQALSHEVTRQRRARRPFSLMMIDVDNFKNYNDRHGHPAGDEVLRTLARALTASLRASDVTARIGGEEFVVMLLDTELPHATSAAEKVRQAVRNTEFLHGSTQPLGRLTISAGVASWPMHGDSAEEVLDAADRALYAAKTAGRDRICAAESIGVHAEPVQPV